MRVKRVYVGLGLVLLLVALFASGFFAYNYFSNSNTELPGFSKDSNADDEALSGDLASDFLVDRGPITQGELLLLENLSKEHSPEAFQEIYREATQRAKKADFIEISKCNVQPLVFDLQGDSFQVKNSDTVAHIVSISESETYTVEPGQTVTVNYNKEPGVYGYGCDGGPFAKGAILVR